MEVILSRFRNLTVLLVVILAQLVLLAYQVKSNEDVRLIRVWAVTAITPIAKVMEIVRRYTIGLAEDYFVLINVREQNRRLQDEVGKLKMDNQFLRTELSTADRARALAAFQTRTPSRTIPSRIIGTGTGANSRVVFTDQGIAAGVTRGMAVVNPDGIVGKVLSSYPTASQVLLITDATFAAGVISQKNRVHGTVKGVGQSKVIVDYVQNEEKVEPGEMFYTSGDDRVFPKGMPVGRVTAVRPGKIFKEIYLTPTGINNGIEEVLVVVEGVHQAIPAVQAPPPPQTTYLAPPPPPEVESGRKQAGQAVPAAGSVVSSTTADKVLDRYRRIGELEGIHYGDPGKIPNFNVDPDKVKPAPPVAAPKPAPSAGTPQSVPPVKRPPIEVRPEPPTPGTPPSVAQPKTGAPNTSAPKSAAPPTQ